MDHAYDPDSFTLGIDNHASYCMTPHKSDFVGTPQRVNVRVRGVAGVATSGLRGTVRWPLEDDDGVRHILTIPNTYYVPRLPMRLLSPQHLAQELKPLESTPNGTYCLQLAHSAKLVWMDRTHSRTIKLSTTNVPILRSAPSYHRLREYEQVCKSHESDLQAFPAHFIVPDDDDPVLPSVPNAPATEAADDTADGESPAASEPSNESPATNKQSSLGTQSTPASEETPATEEQQPQQYVFDLTKEQDDSLNAFEQDDVPTDMSPTEQMRLWHYRLAHISFDKMREMARHGDLPSSFKDCKAPFCSACRFAQATKVPWRTKGTRGRGNIKVATRPGQCVSVDQMESTTPGIIGQMRGWLTKARYRYVTVFVDHFSGFTYLHHHQSITGEETVKGKQAFEALAEQSGVKIMHYHADNGRFADKAFLMDVAEKHQTISFCGVNAHFQNGRAEKRIRDLSDGARTDIIHAKQRWNRAITANLWPYAMRHRCDVDNATIKRGTSESPTELFTGVKVKPKLKHYHPFGCPVYVLNDRMASGKSIPRWESRARIGLYLGMSHRHARSVALVLNIETGHVSPQFHVKYDDLFETIAQGLQPVSIWQEKCYFVRPKPSRTWDIRKRTPAKPKRHAKPNSPGHMQQDQSQQRAAMGIDPPEYFEHGLADEQEGDDAPERDEGGEQQLADEPYVTRAGRQVKLTPKARELALEGVHYEAYAYQAVEFEALSTEDYSEDDKLAQMEDPIMYCLKATSDPDTMYYSQAMKEPDAKQFQKAMVDEVNAHTNNGHWNFILKKAVPIGQIILPAVWAMKRKRRIATREIYKWKSRLNLGGHKMQKGIHYDETYAPVVSWTTIRLFLILSVIFGWHSRQIDFVLAYPQADIKRPTYMEIPKGVKFDGIDRNKHCLHVTKNVYGGRESGRTWFLFMKKGLEDLGFKQSKFDECVFYRGTTTFLVYTDDGIILDPKKENVDQTVRDIRSKFNVEDQGDLADYLGVKVQRHKDGTYEMTQPHLIDSILKDLGLIDENGVARKGVTTRGMPSLTTKLIGPDKGGQPFDYDWNYRSVIGKLNFLEKSTRCDLSYVVHQCARFSADPRRSHGEAIKHLGRYLLETRTKGYTLKPAQLKSFDCYVDADFLWELGSHHCNREC